MRQLVAILLFGLIGVALVISAHVNFGFKDNKLNNLNDENGPKIRVRRKINAVEVDTNVTSSVVRDTNITKSSNNTVDNSVHVSCSNCSMTFNLDKNHTLSKRNTHEKHSLFDFDWTVTFKILDDGTISFAWKNNAALDKQECKNPPNYFNNRQKRNVEPEMCPLDDNQDENEEPGQNCAENNDDQDDEDEDNEDQDDENVEDNVQALTGLPIPEERLSEVTDPDHLRLIRAMMDATSTEDLLKRQYCKQGLKYTSWTLFKAVQQSHYKRTIHKKCPGDYPEVISKAWALIGSSNKEAWFNMAEEIKKMPCAQRPINKKNSIQKYHTCPICLLKTPKIKNHFTDVHFPSYKINQTQRQFFDDVVKDNILNKKLAQNWNEEFVNFWHLLFNPEQERQPEVNQIVSEFGQWKRDMMNCDGEKGYIYLVIQSETDTFHCDQNSMPSKIKYIGKSTTKQLRYFQDAVNGFHGRIGREICDSLKNNRTTYFWKAFEVPMKHHSVIEHLLITGLFQIDYPESRVWNLDLKSFPHDHQLAFVEPKVQVKYGLFWLKFVLDEYLKAVENGSFKRGQELLTHFYGLSDIQQDDFLKRCGPTNERVLAVEGGRHIKKRKLMDGKRCDDQSSGSVRGQFNEVSTHIEQSIQSLPRNKTFTSDEVKEILEKLLSQMKN